MRAVETESAGGGGVGFFKMRQLYETFMLLLIFPEVKGLTRREWRLKGGGV